MQKATHETQKVFDFNAALPTVEPKFRKGSETSRKAAERIAPKVSNLQKIVILHLSKVFRATPDEIAAANGLDRLQIRPRHSELRKLGYISVTGEGLSYSGNPMDSYSLTVRGSQLAQALTEAK